MIRFGVTSAKEDALRERMQACGLVESDLDEQFIRSGGPGGQKVNRTAAGVHLRHVPTGLDVKMTKARSQALNRFYARRRMCELLEQQQLGPRSPSARKQAAIKKQKDRRRRRSTQSR
jgi:protein subunit release factor B